MRLARAAVLVVLLAGAGWLIRGVRPVPWPVVAFDIRSIRVLRAGRSPCSGWTAPGITTDVPREFGEPGHPLHLRRRGANVSVAVTETRGRRGASTGKLARSRRRPSPATTAAATDALRAHPGPGPQEARGRGAGRVRLRAKATAGQLHVRAYEVKRISTIFAATSSRWRRGNGRGSRSCGGSNFYVVDGIARENPHKVDGKEVQVYYDDGRQLPPRRPREKFDIITSDPIDPWVKGRAAARTRSEYYQMCRDHLNPGRIVATARSAVREKQQTRPESADRDLLRGLPGNGILFSNDREGAATTPSSSSQVEQAGGQPSTSSRRGSTARTTRG